MRAISASLVIADVPASPPPRSLISPPKPHQQMSGYTWDETLVLRVVKDLTKRAAPDSIHALSPSPKELVIGYFFLSDLIAQNVSTFGPYTLRYDFFNQASTSREGL